MPLFARMIHGSVLYIWDIVGRNSEQIKIFSGIFVAGFVLWEYYDRQKDERIARALSYVTEHQSRQRMEARVNSRLVWQENPEYRNELEKTFHKYIKLLLPEDVDESATASEQAVFSDHEQEASKITSELVEKYEILENQLHDLHSFYHSTAHCTLSGVCDAQTICQTFLSDVQVFRGIYFEYFDDWAEKWIDNKGLVIDQFLRFCNNKNYQYKYTGQD